jgi:hypothetical protein
MRYIAVNCGADAANRWIGHMVLPNIPASYLLPAYDSKYLDNSRDMYNGTIGLVKGVQGVIALHRTYTIAEGAMEGLGFLSVMDLINAEYYAHWYGDYVMECGGPRVRLADGIPPDGYICSPNPTPHPSGALVYQQGPPGVVMYEWNRNSPNLPSSVRTEAYESLLQQNSAEMQNRWIFQPMGAPAGPANSVNWGALAGRVVITLGVLGAVGAAAKGSVGAAGGAAVVPAAPGFICFPDFIRMMLGLPDEHGNYCA